MHARPHTYQYAYLSYIPSHRLTFASQVLRATRKRRWPGNEATSTVNERVCMSYCEVIAAERR